MAYGTTRLIVASILTPEEDAKAKEVALGMLRRYSRPAIAWEMALCHGCDYKAGSKRAIYWKTVANYIHNFKLVRVEQYHKGLTQ